MNFKTEKSVKVTKIKILIITITLIISIILQVLLIIIDNYGKLNTLFGNKTIFYEVTPYESEIIDTKIKNFLGFKYFSILLSDNKWYSTGTYSLFRNSKAIVYKDIEGSSYLLKVVPISEKVENTSYWYSHNTGLIKPMRKSYNELYIIKSKEDKDLYMEHCALKFYKNIILMLILFQIVIIYNFKEQV